MFCSMFGLMDRDRTGLKVDSSELDRIINTVVLEHIQWGNIEYAICRWMSLLTNYSLGSVNRKRNMSADVLSKCITNEKNNVLIFHTPPVLVGRLFVLVVYNLIILINTSWQKNSRYILIFCYINKHYIFMGYI